MGKPEAFQRRLARQRDELAARLGDVEAEGRLADTMDYQILGASRAMGDETQGHVERSRRHAASGNPRGERAYLDALRNRAYLNLLERQHCTDLEGKGCSYEQARD